jgi:hypothetical protein
MYITLTSDLTLGWVSKSMVRSKIKGTRVGHDSTLDNMLKRPCCYSLTAVNVKIELKCLLYSK